MQMSSKIDAGIIKRNRGRPSQEDVRYEIRFMDESHMKDIMNLQDIIIHSLADKEIFRTRPLEPSQKMAS
jgi:hypothetical protein